MSSDSVLYSVSERVATITINRPEAANALTFGMLDALDEAWTAAAADPEVRVILLRANGKHFSAGHDMKEVVDIDTTKLDQIYDAESRRYLGYALHWRNVPKPSIAAVQGACVAGALPLCWPCDLIVAADNAKFSDPVVALGIGGIEYHGHTWELGPRKAKELLFTGRVMTAAEALQVGMVNRIVPLDELEAASHELAQEIAQQHPFALRQAKRAVNQTLDVQGFHAAIQSAFDIHELGHGNALSEAGTPVLAGLDRLRQRGHLR